MALKTEYRLKIFLVWMFLAGLPSCARGQETQVTRACNVVPRPLEDICLGMTKEELQTVRPGVRKEPESPPDRLIEMGIDSPFFDRVAYRFKDGLLAKIVLSKNVQDPGYIDRFRAAFLHDAVKSWGSDFERYVRTQRGSNNQVHQFPVLIWKEPDAIIAAIYTPSLRWRGDELAIAKDPVAKFFFLYFEVVIMTPILELDEISALELLPETEVQGVDRLFVDLDSRLRGRER